jgi:LacI family transcriptional regulator
MRFVTEPHEAPGYAAARELLDRPTRPTAPVSYDAKIAVGALHAATQRGLHVPPGSTAELAAGALSVHCNRIAG